MSFLTNLNQNVLFTFLYKFSDGIAQGVWSLASMGTYIYLLENKSTKVCRGDHISHTHRNAHCDESIPPYFAVRGLGARHSGNFRSCVCNSRQVAQNRLIVCKQQLPLLAVC